MPSVSRANVDEIIRRIESIPDDAEPKWGTLRKDSLIEHLIWAVKGSMNTSQPVPYQGSSFLKNIAGPLLLLGLVQFPKNVKFKDDEGEVVYVRATGTIEDLRAVINTFVEGVANGTLETSSHPAFGPIGPKKWAIFHYRHFEHHLGQFGV